MNANRTKLNARFSAHAFSSVTTCRSHVIVSCAIVSALADLDMTMSALSFVSANVLRQNAVIQTLPSRGSRSCLLRHPKSVLVGWDYFLARFLTLEISSLSIQARSCLRKLESVVVNWLRFLEVRTCTAFLMNMRLMLNSLVVLCGLRTTPTTR